MVAFGFVIMIVYGSVLFGLGYFLGHIKGVEKGTDLGMKQFLAFSMAFDESGEFLKHLGPIVEKMRMLTNEQRKRQFDEWKRRNPG